MASSAGFGRFSAWQVAQWIAELMELDALYLALNGSDPFVTDPATSELIGSSYNRQRGAFVTAGANAIVQPLDVIWGGLPLASVVAAVTVWDRKIGGQMRAGFVLKNPINLPDGGDVRIPGGTFLLGLDVVTI